MQRHNMLAIFGLSEISCPEPESAGNLTLDSKPQYKYKLIKTQNVYKWYIKNFKTFCNRSKQIICFTSYSVYCGMHKIFQLLF